MNKSFFSKIILIFSISLFYAEKIKVPVTGLVNAGRKTTELEVEWNEKWFGEKPSNQYNHNIARISALLSSNSYSKVDEAIKDGTLDKNELHALYKKLGVAEEDIFYKYDMDYSDQVFGIDQAAFSLAVKKIDSAIGKKNLVFVSIRGTVMNRNEWISNLNISDLSQESKTFHEGFLKCATQINSELEHFLLKRKIDPKDTFFLLSGHSRGAAIVNLLAAKIAEEDLYDTKKIYAYPIGCPNVVNLNKINVDVKAEKYSFIWNIGNKEDLVPSVPPNRNTWKFSKYGNNKTIPCRWNTDEKTFEENYLPRADAVYEKFMARGFIPFRTGNFIPSQVTRFLTDSYKNTKKYYKFFMSPRRIAEKTLNIILYGDDDEIEGVRHFGDLPRTFSDIESSKLAEVMFHFIDMHTPEAYVAWMLALDEPEIFAEMESTALILKGSENCIIFDKNWEKMLEVKSGDVVYKSVKAPVCAYSLSDKTYIGLPPTDEYSLFLQKESLFPSPLNIKIERYDSEGFYKGDVLEQKVFIKNKNSYKFTSGASAMELNADSKIELKKAEEINDLKAYWNFYFSPEFNVAINGEVQFGLHLGTKGVHSTLLFTPNDKSKFNDSWFDFSLGIGFMTNIFSRIYAEQEFLWDFRGKTPAARSMLSFQPGKKTQFFMAGMFDFNFKDGFDWNPALQFGIKF